MHGVVSRAAWHLAKGLTRFLADLAEEIDHGGGDHDRRLVGDGFDVVGDVPSRTDGGDPVFEIADDFSFRFLGNAADVDAEGDFAGDDVHRAGGYLYDAHGADGGRLFTGGGQFFHQEDDFGGGAAPVLAHVHGGRAAVIGVTVEVDAQAGGSGDAGDDADVGMCRFQHFPLLDVDFKEGFEGGSVRGVFDMRRVEAAPF